MKNTLSIIQTLFKIGKILSKIVFVFCIVGVVGCFIAILCLAVGVDGALKFGGVTLHGIIEENAEMTVGNLYAATISGLILAAAEAVLAKFAEIYFQNELNAGTPFTYNGAKELFRLGILTIAIPLGATVFAAVVRGIMASLMSGVSNMDFSDGTSVSLGVMFLVMSVVFRYGAEISESKTEYL